MWYVVLIAFLLQWWLKVPPYLNHVLLKCGTYSQKAKSTTTIYEVSIPQCGTYSQKAKSTTSFYEVSIPHCGTYSGKAKFTIQLHYLLIRSYFVVVLVKKKSLGHGPDPPTPPTPGWAP